MVKIINCILLILVLIFLKRRRFIAGFFILGNRVIIRVVFFCLFFCIKNWLRFIEKEESRFVFRFR